MSGLMPIISPGGAALPEVALLQATEDDTNSSSYSFNGQNFGAAHSKRRLICYVAARDGSGGTMLITSASIGGVAATVHVSRAETGGSARMQGYIISADVPTGTSGTVSINFDSTANECKIHLFRAINLQSGTPHHTASDITDPLSMSLDVPEGGIVVGGGLINDSGLITTTGVTEEYDAVYVSFGRTACGSAQQLPAETGRTVSFNQGTGVFGVGVCASWR